MKKTKKFLYSITIVLSALACVIAPLEAFAERVNSGVTETTIQNTLKVLRTEARAAHTAFVFYKCVKLSKSLNEHTKGKNILGDPASWLRGWATSGGTVNAGAWLEDKIGGEVDDGAIYCEENDGKLINFFAQQIGLNNAEKLICNNGSPGMFYDEKSTGKCSTSSNNQHYITDGWINHVALYYDAYAEEHNWKYRFHDIASGSWSYPEVIGYTMYIAEVEYGCGKSAGTSKPVSGDYISEPVKTVNEYGETTDEYYYGKDTAYVVPGASDGDHLAFVSAATNYTCLDMVKGSTKNSSDGVLRGANPRASYFQEEIYELIRTGCEEAFTLQYNAAKEQIAKDTVSEEKKEKLQSAIDEYDAMKAAGEFTEKYNTDGLQCKDVEFLATVSQEYWEDTDLNDPDADADGGDCYTNAASLGWIVCPLIEQMSTMIQEAYEDLVTPFLVLDPELFDNSSDTSPGAGTFQAWGDFRNFANIVFIILFIFVIFSQLTGVGIDNYGVKKILPKLIIGAILINLSYIICQLCIDVANIVGYGIGGIFNGIATFDASKIYVEGGIVPHGLVSGIGILIALVAAFTVGAVLIGGPAVLIPVLMGLLSILIGILFCFILLAVRKAFAVILVVVSPLAFACYMLPNTKSIFDKWFNGFKAVLLAFPICSAMIYGGQMVARILIMATGASQGTVGMPLAMAISAAVISIVPIFMIPKVLQGSMGAISTGIAGMRARANGRARGAVARSGWAQDKQRATMEMRNRRLAGVNKDGELTRRSRKLYDRDSAVGKFRRNKVMRHVPIVGISQGKDDRVAAARTRTLNDLDVRESESNASGATYEKTKFQHDVANVKNSAEFAELTGNNDAKTMGESLKKLTTDEKAMADPKAKAKRMALAQAMASGNSEMKKELATQLRTMDGKFFKELSEDSGVREGVGDKDAFVSAALKAANTATTGEGESKKPVESFSYGEWANDANKQDVIQNVLDKNNLFSQSSAVQKEAIGMGVKVREDGKIDDSGALVSAERLQSAVDNDNLDINDEMRQFIADKRHISRSGSSTPADIAEGGNGQTGQKSNWSAMTKEQRLDIVHNNPRKPGEKTDEWMKRINNTQPKS